MASPFVFANSKLSRRGFLGATGIVAATTALAACSSDSDSDSSSNAASTTSNEEERRVVVLNTGQLDNMLMLGILPVGTAKAKNSDVVPQFIRDRFGGEYDLDSITDCGVRANPDLEVIASLNPTLICANSRTDEAILAQLKEIAPVITGSGGGENWKEDLLTIADGVGMEAKAQSLLDEYTATASELAGEFGADAPTVSFLRTKDDAFQLYGVQSMAGIVASDCGLPRPDNQQFDDSASIDLSAEQLGEADADWLFYGVGDGGADPSTTSVWPALNAVANGQAVQVDYEAWYMNASLLSAQIIRDGLREHILG
ncbi:MAG: iron-siderophore ABC transporter substrate-binding protein [Corynebacterium sp.]|nr:iron-siderophore ABC transporter substrate-binding protein [Corynebacterium sp.]